MIKLEEDLANRLKDALLIKLGEDFTVVSSYATASIEGLQIHGNPDLVIRNSQNDHVTFIEFKGRSPTSDLPFATIPVLRQIKAANMGLNPDLVLVTSSQVSPSLETQFEEENVRLIKFEGMEKLVSSLMSMLKPVGEVLWTWRDLIKPIFPKHARLIPKVKNDNEGFIRIDWLLKSDPNRPNKRSRPIVIQFTREAIEDYLAAKVQRKDRANKLLVEHLTTLMKNFSPNHETPREVPAQEVAWVIDTMDINQ